MGNDYEPWFARFSGCLVILGIIAVLGGFVGILIFTGVISW